MGGLDPAMPIVEAALKAGRPVVTANKLLLATFGARLELLARASDTSLRTPTSLRCCASCVCGCRGLSRS